MKKLISLFVVAMMVLTCVVPAFAAKAGETVEVTFALNTDAKYATYAADVEVAEGLSIVEIKDELGGGMFAANGGKVSLVNFADAYESGDVFTVVVKVADDAAAGEYAVTASITASNATGATVATSNETINVTVEADEPVTPPVVEPEEPDEPVTPPVVEPEEPEVPDEPKEEVTGNYFVLIAKAGENGEISPEGMIKVKENGKQIFDIKANEGYVIEKLTVGGKEVTKAAGEAKYNLTVSNVVENMTVEVTFVAASVEEKPAPSTGANDFVGAAVALAVVSAMGAAVISKR